jgi:hypothetical protein
MSAANPQRTTAYFPECASSNVTVDGPVARLLQDHGLVVLVSPAYSWRSTSDTFLRFHEGIQHGRLPGPGDWLEARRDA